jgi:hypothetical protein
MRDGRLTEKMTDIGPITIKKKLSINLHLRKCVSLLDHNMRTNKIK